MTYVYMKLPASWGGGTIGDFCDVMKNFIIEI